MKLALLLNSATLCILVIYSLSLDFYLDPEDTSQEHQALLMLCAKTTKNDVGCQFQVTNVSFLIGLSISSSSDVVLFSLKLLNVRLISSSR